MSFARNISSESEFTPEGDFSEVVDLGPGGIDNMRLKAGIGDNDNDELDIDGLFKNAVVLGGFIDGQEIEDDSEKNKMRTNKTGPPEPSWVEINGEKKRQIGGAWPVVDARNIPSKSFLEYQKEKENLETEIGQIENVIKQEIINKFFSEGIKLTGKHIKITEKGVVDIDPEKRTIFLEMRADGKKKYKELESFFKKIIPGLISRYKKLGNLRIIK